LSFLESTCQLSDLVGRVDTNEGTFNRREVRRIVAACRKSGDHELAEKVSSFFASEVDLANVDPELDPAFEKEVYVEPPELKERLDSEEHQESTCE
jgi:hypothetical protein